MTEFADNYWTFISEHLHDDPAQLMLRYAGKLTDFDVASAVTQIECRRRTAGKLPTFNSLNRFYYPSRLSAEQSSNEEISRYHASLVERGASVADLTAGLGIDAMTMAVVAESVDAYEMNQVTNAALRHNSQEAGLDNFHVMEAGDSIEMLGNSSRYYDLIFIDPARRGGSSERTYAFKDCTPDVVSHLELLKSRCRRLIIKASPMLDLQECARQLPGARRITAVSRRGECKEVLIEVESTYHGVPEYDAVNIATSGEYVRYKALAGCGAELLAHAGEVAAGKYIYEPNASVMKLGSLAGLTHHYPTLRKLDVNTNVYVSDEMLADFPGRRLAIECVTSLTDKKLRSLKGSKINVVSRNFRQSAESVRKRLGVKDGGDDFLYAVTISGKPVVLLCKPL